MLVEWRPEKDHILNIPVMGGKHIRQTGSVSLLPGGNEVDNEKWMKARGLVKDKIEVGTIIEYLKIKISEDGKEDLAPLSFKDMKPTDAERFITNCWDINSLRIWKNDNQKDSVRTLILNQIEYVEHYLKTGQKKEKVRGR